MSSEIAVQEKREAVDREGRTVPSDVARIARQMRRILQPARNRALPAFKSRRNL